MEQTTGYLIFSCIFLTLFCGDVILHRRFPNATLRQNIYWSLICISSAIGFGGWMYYSYGSQKALEFYTGYLVELALSVDNLFVFVLIFTFFSVPKAAQHRALTWGIIGAIIMRAVFIFTGTYLLSRFHWLMYVMGLILIASGYNILRGNLKEHMKPDQTLPYRIFQRFISSTPDYVGEKFIVKINGKMLATPLFFVLIAIETTDLVFAIDSIPAIFGITKDSFIVLTSNIFAIVGLRSLYHIISEAIYELRFLNVSLAIVLAVIGMKMVFIDIVHVPTLWSLLFVGTVIAAGIGASLLYPEQRS